MLTILQIGEAIYVKNLIAWDKIDHLHQTLQCMI